MFSCLQHVYVIFTCGEYSQTRILVLGMREKVIERDFYRYYILHSDIMLYPEILIKLPERNYRMKVCRFKYIFSCKFVFIF